MALRSPTSLLNSVDFPTLGLPTTATTLLIPNSQISNLQISFQDRKSTRLNSSHMSISYAVFCLKKKKKKIKKTTPNNNKYNKLIKRSDTYEILIDAC